MILQRAESEMSADEYQMFGTAMSLAGEVHIHIGIVPVLNSL